MKVKITNKIVDGLACWYEVGDVYDVIDYRHNPRQYWEIVGWDGDTDMYQCFWILKKHAKIIDEIEPLDKELFEI